MAARPLSKERKITVLLADDHPVVREGLCTLLECDGRYEVVGQAGDGSTAVRMAKVRRPDVILMDISMPGLNGLDATRQVLAHQPGTKVLILSVNSGADYIKYAIEAGAAGFVPKHLATESLLEAITEVVSGKVVFLPAAAKGRSRTLHATERMYGG